MTLRKTICVDAAQNGAKRLLVQVELSLFSFRKLESKIAAKRFRFRVRSKYIILKLCYRACQDAVNAAVVAKFKVNLFTVTSLTVNGLMGRSWTKS